MTNLFSSRLLRPVYNPDDVAGGCAEQNGAVASMDERLSDDLLKRLPTDRRCSGAPFSLAEATYTLSGDRLDRLSAAAIISRGDRDALCLTAFAILLARLTGQDVVTLRKGVDAFTIVTLSFGPEMSFRSLLAASLMERAPLDRPCAVEFVSTTARTSSVVVSDDALRLSICDADGDLRVRLASTTGLWGPSVLELWLRYFDHLLTAAGNSPDVLWKRLPLLDPAKAQEFYHDFNNTQTAYPAPASVLDLVTRQVERTPDAIAIASDLRSFTYRQLQERSDAIAAQLSTLGAGPNRAVAVCVGRTAELPVALLGILKSGSCYVPLDPQEARRRMLTILEESQPVAIIADRLHASLSDLVAMPVLDIEESPQRAGAYEPRGAAPTADDLAYTIYTSGTTGKPKGVTITHGALANLLTSFVREPGFTACDRLLAVSPISFDIATLDMFLPLIAGGTLVVADRLVAADPFRLAAMLEKWEITVLQATPATWRLLESSGWEGKGDLKMISGGEALPRDLANELLRLGAELWNCYGPTETTIYSGVVRVQAERGLVTVGPPIANTTFYVLDEMGRLLPPGVPGELYIGGAGVSPGYVDRAPLTKQRFLPDPYAPSHGARMFRSGDLVRLINGCEFEFFGRLDHQVKLRGYRIELGEIESVLRTFPGVDNAVAGLRQNGQEEPYLVAYFTVRHEQPDLLQLRDHLSQLLPSYMLPSRFVLMDALPLTSSGKIDRAALLTADPVASGLPAHRQPDGVKPHNELESTLLAVFREVLGKTEFGVTDSFFDYGGYSLLTVRLFTRINRALNLTLPISMLFDAPTVRALAEMVEHAQLLPMIVPIRPRGKSAPLFVIHSYLLYGVLPQIVEHDRPVYGVRERVDMATVQTVEDRAKTYVQEILNVYPNGPLLLTGWCAAGSLTVEIARQLRALDHPVGLVALFDAERPGYRPNVRGNRAARILSRLKFHQHRLRRADGLQKLAYVGNALRHSWGSILESLFMHQRPLVLSLQRLFGFTLPDAVFNNTWSRVAAIQNYTPANYPGKIMLFRAKDVPQLPGGDDTLGWKEVVDDGVEVVFVPGDHESMFLDPNVGTFSKHLRQALQLAG